LQLSWGVSSPRRTDSEDCEGQIAVLIDASSSDKHQNRALQWIMIGTPSSAEAEAPAVRDRD